MWTLIILVISALLAVPAEAIACGDNPERQCLSDGAYCQAGECKCSSGYDGSGYLACHAEADDACSLINDPTLETFQKQHVDLPVPCRYHALDIVTRYPNSGTNEWKCKAIVAGFNERIKGKIFTRGFDVQVTYLHGAQEKVFKMRVKGQVQNGEYEYERAIKKPDSLVWMSQTDNNLHLDFLPFNHSIVFAENEADNRLELRIPFCALEVFFRPAHPDQGKNQVYVPGLSIAVSDSNHQVTWELADNKTMCLTPASAGVSADTVASSLGLTRQEAFVYLSFIYTDHQEFPGSSDQCHQVKEVAEACTDVDARKKGLESCLFILNEPNFVRCWEYGGMGYDSDTILELFKVCLQAFCTKNNAECVSVRDTVKYHACGTHSNSPLMTTNCQLS